MIKKIVGFLIGIVLGAPIGFVVGLCFWLWVMSDELFKGVLERQREKTLERINEVVKSVKHNHAGDDGAPLNATVVKGSFKNLNEFEAWLKEQGVEGTEGFMTPDKGDEQ